VLTKQDMLDAIAELPENATFEDAVEKLYFLEMIDHGLADLDNGRWVTHEEARRRMAHWLQ
jgi:predicted transcriptional regulator